MAANWVTCESSDDYAIIPLFETTSLGGNFVTILEVERNKLDQSFWNRVNVFTYPVGGLSSALNVDADSGHNTFIQLR